MFHERMTLDGSDPCFEPTCWSGEAEFSLRGHLPSISEGGLREVLSYVPAFHGQIVSPWHDGQRGMAIALSNPFEPE